MYAKPFRFLAWGAFCSGLRLSVFALLCLTASKCVEAQSLSKKQISDQIASASQGASAIKQTARGTVIMGAPMQAMEAEIGGDGVILRSTGEAGSAELKWTLSAFGRTGRLVAMSAEADVNVVGNVVSVNHAQQNVIEEFTSSSDGIRQDFLIVEPPTGAKSVELELTVKGATVATVGENEESGIRLRMSDGRILKYAKLHVTDSSGATFPARMKPKGSTGLRVTVDDIGARYPLRIDPTFTDADWTSLQVDDCNGNIKAAIGGGGSLYIAGSFTTVGGTPANRVAKWNGTSWSALGLGTDGFVRALAFDSASGTLFVGGSFSQAGGIASNNIAKWDGVSWSAMGVGTTFAVNALAWDASGARLFAGGGGSANNLVQWKAGVWSSVGNAAIDQSVDALAWDGVSTLYVGGTFKKVGSLNVNSIASWNGVSWSGVGDNEEGDVAALAWEGVSGRLFAVKKLLFGNAAVVRQWKNNTWSQLGPNFSTYPTSLLWANGELIAGGFTFLSGGQSIASIKRWNGTSWTLMGDVTGTSATVAALAKDPASNMVVVIGTFTAAGGNGATNIARYDGTNWQSMGGGGTNGAISAMAWSASTNSLYVGGDFLKTSAGNAGHIAKWNGNTWSTLGSGLNASVRTLVLDEASNRLFAGGDFTTAGGASANRIAQWDGNAWSPLGGGIDDGFVRALAWDKVGNRLFAGGTFTSASGMDTRRIAQWKNNIWLPVNQGIEGNAVNGMAWNATTSTLYVGGDFVSAGGISAQNIAKWKANVWSPMGDGIDGRVSALSLDEATGRVYAGGIFTMAGTAPANSVAVWNGAAWSSLGIGVEGSVVDLRWDPIGKLLFAGGSFSKAGGIGAAHIAQWDGSAWTALGSGADADVLAMAWDASGHRLFAGGYFSNAGGKPASIAVANVRRTGYVLFNTLTFHYDGTPKLVSAILTQEPTASCTVVPSSIGPQAGQYNVSATCSGTSFDGEKVAVATILKKFGTAVIDTQNFTYSGAKRIVTAHISEEPDTSCEVTPAEIGPAAGSYLVTVSCNGTNYSSYAENVAVTISKANGTVAFDASTFVYDGFAKNAAAHIAEEPQSFCFMSPSAIGPNAGSYPVNASCDGQNYTAGGNYTLSISKALGDVKFGSLSFVYDGSPKTVSAGIVQEPSASCVVAPSPIGTSVGVYPVNANCNGVNYTASGGATARITAAIVSPLAIGDGIVVNSGQTANTVNGKAGSVLDNDFNPNLKVFGVGMTATLVTSPTNGSLSLSADGKFTYTNTVGSSDTFRYKACAAGATSQCSTTQVKITVLPSGTALPLVQLPEAVNDAALVNVGSETHTLFNGSETVLSNDYDPNKLGSVLGTLVASLPSGSSVSQGTLNFNLPGKPSGSFSYSSASNPGTDQFYYQACDDLFGSCALATVTISIFPAGQMLPTVLLPVAVDDQIQVLPLGQTSMLIGNASSTLWNDYNPNDAGNSNKLQAWLVGSGPQHGTLNFQSGVLPTGGTFAYKNLDGSSWPNDGFSYQACDTLYGACAFGKVSIEVSSNQVLNRLPQPLPDTLSVPKGGEATTLANLSTSVLSNDTDPDPGESAGLRAFLLGSGPQHGSIQLYADGSFKYTHNNDSAISDSFVYEACDMHGGCAAAVVSINIQAGQTNPTIKCQLPTQVYLAGGTIATDGSTPFVNLNFSSLFIAPANDSLTFAVNGLPMPPLSLNAESGQLSGKFGSSNAGVYLAEVVATGAQGFAKQTIKFDVLAQADHLFRHGFGDGPACQ